MLPYLPIDGPRYQCDNRQNHEIVQPRDNMRTHQMRIADHYELRNVKAKLHQRKRQCQSKDLACMILSLYHTFYSKREIGMTHAKGTQSMY